MSGMPDAVLSDTIYSILLAFEAPPQAIEHYRDGNVRSDPFTWTQQFYNFIEIDDGFGLKIQVLVVLIGISTVLSTATLIFQYCSPSQRSVRWLFRRQYHTQSKIPYIVPHPVNIVVLASFITGLLLTVYLGFTYHAFEAEKWPRLIRISSWFPAVWFTYYAAVWLSGFGSLYLTYLVPSQYTRRGSLTGVRRHASPVLVNALCFGVPLLCVASVVPLQVKQAGEMRGTMRDTRALYNVLGPLALAWQTAPNPLQDVSLVDVQQAAKYALAKKHTWEGYWTAELVLWSLWSLLALAIAVPFCLALVFSTHRRISRMATTQAGANPWTSRQFKKHSPPIGQTQGSPSSSIKEGISPSPRSSGVFSEAWTPRSFMSSSSVPPYSSPASSFPPSTVQTPSVFEHATQPFFAFQSPATTSSTKSPSFAEASPSGSSVPLPHLDKGKTTRSGRPYGRQSLHALRRLSHSAVFPSRAGSLDHRAKSHLDDLNKRYWHIAAEYTTVLLVMVLICAFALFELVSQSKILLDCPKKVLSTIVVTFTYGCLVNIWLAYNLYRLYRDSQKSGTSSRSGSTSGSSSSEGGRRFTEPVISEEYTLSQKRPSKSLVHFADVLSSGSEYEPERRPSTTPRPGPTAMDGVARGGHDHVGLNIEYLSNLAVPTSQRPSVSGQTLHQSFERRRSSYRAPSMDLTEALAMGPGTFSRRCSVQR